MIAQIMIIGKSETATKAIFDAIHLQKRWSATIVMDVESALEMMHKDMFDIVLIEASVKDQDFKKIEKITQILSPNTTISIAENIPALEATLISILNNKNKENQRNFIITDDALKNAVLNISLN